MEFIVPLIVIAAFGYVAFRFIKKSKFVKGKQGDVIPPRNDNDKAKKIK